jgi:SAM-dependent methyltransferase
MSLARATLRGQPLGLRGPGPWSGADLRPFVGQKFVLPTDDPWFHEATGPARAYLEGSREAWLDHPEHMDFLDPESPVRALKLAQRELCLAGWGAAPAQAQRVLDVGAGIGRFSTWFLDRGADVWAVDPDVDSLRRLVWHAAGRPGRLDVHRASAHHLPDVRVDHLVCAEVLCYVPDAVGALRAAASRLRPGGTAWISLEARWGWAVAPDAPAGAWRAALETGVVDVPGRWVRTYDEAAVRSLIADAGLRLDALVPSHWTFDGPLENVLPPDPPLATLLELEARCRRHPVFAPLHRLWLVAATRPE